jgi:hypothetical protein
VAICELRDSGISSRSRQQQQTYRKSSTKRKYLCQDVGRWRYNLKVGDKRSQGQAEVVRASNTSRGESRMPKASIEGNEPEHRCLGGLRKTVHVISTDSC